MPRDTELQERLKAHPLPDLLAPAPAPAPEQSRPVSVKQAPPQPAAPELSREAFAMPQLDARESHSRPSTARTLQSAPPASRSPGEAPVIGKEQVHAPTLAATTSEPDRRSLPIATDLVELANLVSECKSCELHQERKQTVFSRGTMKSGLLFVGEAPGEEEDLQGAPFVGPAGQLLDKMVSAMGLSRDEVYVCNIIKCRPPNNRHPSSTELSTCRPYLEKQIELLDPKVIVALGGTAVSGLLGITEGITRVRGRFRLYQGQIAVMPTFHPAYLLRTPAAKRQVWADLLQVLRHLGLPSPSRDQSSS